VRYASTLGLTSPFSITPAFEECPDELQQPLVYDTLGDLAHQFVVIDSIEEFFQIEINHPSVALHNILLRLSHGLMRRPIRSKPIAVVGKRRVPSLLQNLHHRLLDEAIQHSWDAPSFRIPPPSGFGISTRLTGFGSYVPFSNCSRIAGQCCFR
jgi:hypothetical protein